MTDSTNDSDKSPIYDLAAAAADYERWEGPPRRTILVCTHMRCGSTLLGEAMYFAGGLGCPIEYFHAGFRPWFEQRWKAPDHASYLKAVYAHRVDSTGTLGVKVFWRDLVEMCQARFPSDAARLGSNLATDPDAAALAYRLVRQLVEEVFPNPTFVHLRRLDLLRLAVSHVLSVKTGAFRDLPGAPVAEQSAGEVEFDYEFLERHFGLAIYCEERWREYFSSAGISPIELAYEDLLARYVPTVQPLLRRLGALQSDRVPAPRLRRQASELSERFALQYLREHSRRAASARA